MIKIICVGSIKENYLQDALNEYTKRLQKYTKLEIIEVKDIDYPDLNKCLTLEGAEILKHLNPKDYNIILDIKGEELDSLSFAKKLSSINNFNSNITFIIGGSNGLSNDVKEKANYRLSFSSLTFPHQLFRVMLLEQIYRAYKINNHETYHK
jgi:23S rRNA (pseudouridine1915-N3)-methyltransferase